MQHNKYDLKQVEGMSIKPFYLRKSGNKMRSLVIALLILLVLTVANPIVLIVSIPYTVYTFMIYRKSKRTDQILINRAIDHYSLKEFDKAYDELHEALKINAHEKKAIILMALLECSRENYARFIELINSVHDKEINYDLDIQLKLAEAYEKTGCKEKAEEIYRKLLKYFKNSKYLNEKLSSLTK